MIKQPGVKFIYLFCNDLDVMRHFYSDLVGLNEIYFSPDPDGAVAYDCDGLQFTIFSDKLVKAGDQGWSKQPGWDGGMQTSISWSVVLTQAGFQSAVRKLQDAGVETFYKNPHWHNYWSFPVKDPMGNTVEIVWDSGEKLKWDE